MKNDDATIERSCENERAIPKHPYDTIEIMHKRLPSKMYTQVQMNSVNIFTGHKLKTQSNAQNYKTGFIS